MLEKLYHGNQMFFEQMASVENEIIISESRAMQTILNEIRSINRSPLPTLILGKAGVGKELLAKELFHTYSNKTHSFFKVNASSLNLRQANEKLFNGNEHSIHGFLEKYAGNTLFIKEIDKLDVSLQLKLLKVLKSTDYKSLERVMEIRIICSAHTGLLEKTKDGQFCNELFSQLSRHLLFVPDLRERTQDIPKLIQYYLAKNRFTGDVEQKVLDILKNYNWKGNVMELKNLCVRLSAICSGQDCIRVSDLPLNIKESEGLPLYVKYNPKVSLEKIKNRYIKLAIDHFKCKRKAAEALGISVKTIYNKELEGSCL